MLLNSRVSKLNFSRNSRLLTIRCSQTPTPPSSPSPIRITAVSYITPEDITYAIEEAKEISKTDPKLSIVKWDIVYELWTHYQRQEDRKNIYKKLDVLECFCEQDMDSALECREYDL